MYMWIVPLLTIATITKIKVHVRVSVKSEMEVAATPSVFNTNSHTMIPRSEIAIKYLDHHIKSVFKTKDRMDNPQNPNIALIVLPIDVARQVLLCLLLTS